MNNLLSKEIKELKKEIDDQEKKKYRIYEDLKELEREMDRILKEIKTLNEGSSSELISLKKRITENETSLKGKENDIKTLEIEAVKMEERIKMKKEQLLNSESFLEIKSAIDHIEFLNTENCMNISERNLDNEINECYAIIK